MNYKERKDLRLTIGKNADRGFQATLSPPQIIFSSCDSNTPVRFIENEIDSEENTKGAKACRSHQFKHHSSSKQFWSSDSKRVSIEIRFCFFFFHRGASTPLQFVSDKMQVRVGSISYWCGDSVRAHTICTGVHFYAPRSIANEPTATRKANLL